MKRCRLAQIKKILVIRTDRIGEVLLSTPILTALKEKWPEAEISVMVRPEVRGLLEGNPNVNEIIEWIPAFPTFAGTEMTNLVRFLKANKFDVVIIVNPKKEFHLAAFLARIPIRVGFDRKWGFLLTHKVKDMKSLAERHEVEYNLDLVRAIGIEPKDRRPVLIVTDTDKDKIRKYKDKEGKIGENKGKGIIAIHPCTSNPKKQWPVEYFARLGDLLSQDGVKVALVSGQEGLATTRQVISKMKNKPLDLSGKLTLKELAAFFKKCDFVISGDSGPVHIAAAVGTPVVVLFGRQDPGSNPTRWGPCGEGHIVIQKDKLGDITPEEVIKVIPA